MPEYDDQYALEVARAQRGSGFIAAEVSPTGEVLSEAIDPGYLNAPSSDYRAAAALAAAITRRREEEARAEMRARQFKATQEFSRREKLGERREDILMDLAPELYGGSPRDLMSLTRLANGPEPKVDLAPVRAQQHVIDQENRQRMSEISRLKNSLTGENLAFTPKAARPGITNELNRLQGELETGRSNYVRTASQPAEAAAIRAQFRAGKITRAQAEQQLKALGFE